MFDTDIFTKQPPEEFKNIWSHLGKNGRSHSWAGAFRISLAPPKIHCTNPIFSESRTGFPALKDEIRQVMERLMVAWTFDDGCFDPIGFHHWLNNYAVISDDGHSYSYLKTVHGLYHIEINLTWNEITVNAYNRNLVATDELAARILSSVDLNQDVLSFAQDICKALADRYQETPLFDLYHKLSVTAMTLDQLPKATAHSKAAVSSGKKVSVRAIRTSKEG